MQKKNETNKKIVLFYKRKYLEKYGVKDWN